jgi:hypothetical protein
MVIFDGVSITDSKVINNTGYTLLFGSTGSIHADNGFPLSRLEHEYGHYLQGQYYGVGIYYSVILPASLYSMKFDSKNHDNYWTEKDANAWATFYFGIQSAIGKDQSLPKEFSYLMNNLINH